MKKILLWLVCAFGLLGAATDGSELFIKSLGRGPFFTCVTSGDECFFCKKAEAPKVSTLASNPDLIAVRAHLDCSVTYCHLICLLRHLAPLAPIEEGVIKVEAVKVGEVKLCADEIMISPAGVSYDCPRCGSTIFLDSAELESIVLKSFVTKQTFC